MNLITRTIYSLAVATLCSGLFLGCQTPDLKPFSDASATLSTSVKKGGELAISPLAETPLWVQNSAGAFELVQPSSEAHPYKKLDEEWGVRRNAMDAVLVYSASLEAINQASTHRQENAQAVVGSVQRLAGAVPGYGAAFDSAGKLVVSGLGMVVEVVAWHDMRRAVQSADPAIQLVARGLTNDLAGMLVLYKAPLKTQIARITDEMRPLVGYENALRTQRDAQRESVETSVSDVAKGAELTRLDALYAKAKVDLEQKRSQLAKIKGDIAQGQEFFNSTILAVNAWADAHAQLVIAFRENQQPNLALLAARAQEVKEIVDQFKKK
jgi:hypothetical protein